MSCNCSCKKKILELEAHLEEKKKEIEDLKARLNEQQQVFTEHKVKRTNAVVNKLTKEDISRYSRQLILPELGVKGQLALCNGSVLVVGCGGLGCPSAIYLAAAGVGCLGLVDHDVVEISNLHRQVLHTEAGIGLQKSTSIAQACSRLNSSIKCVPYHESLNSTNALDIIRQYDVVLDATDNVATRYLLNDACVLAGKPLVSGSALKFEGQLTVYNYNKGPCYRCLFPEPPPANTVTNCSDGGVLGAVPGVIGVLQATEAIKILASMGEVLSQRLLLYDGMDSIFRTIKLRPHQAGCRVCGDTPTVTSLIDYVQFCGASPTDKDKSVSLLKSEERISAKEYAGMLEEHYDHLLLDVRTPVELEICKLPHPSTNIPFDKLGSDEAIKEVQDLLRGLVDDPRRDPPVVYVVCRRGNDSQKAVEILKSNLSQLGVVFKDIRGGLHAWARSVDPDFPVY